ncbi:hypothetical protein N9O88_01845 [bacterium]|nr:hypothetical protein [bacterium]
MSSAENSAENTLKNMLNFLKKETEVAVRRREGEGGVLRRDINKVVGHGSRAHTLSSWHLAKKNLWTEWLFYFNKANKNEKVDKDKLKELLNGYIKLFEKFKLTICPQQIEGGTCLIVSNSLSKLSKEYGLDYSLVPPLIGLAARKVPDKIFEEASREMVLDQRAAEARGSVLPNPRAAEDRGGGKKRKTKKRKKSRNKKIKTSKRKKKKQTNKRKTIKGGTAAAEEPTSISSLAAAAAAAAAEEPTSISSLAVLAAEQIKNDKDLEYAKNIDLGDKKAIDILKEAITKKILEEDVRRVRDSMSSGQVTMGFGERGRWNPPVRRVPKTPKTPE